MDTEMGKSSGSIFVEKSVAVQVGRPEQDPARNGDANNKENKQSPEAMTECNDTSYVNIDQPQLPNTPTINKISILPLVFLIFFEASGGPFGIEDTVNAAGPLLSLIGFVIFPFIWSIPEALITAEMGTMFPEDGGYVIWVSTALGEYWGFQDGWVKWLSGVIDNAVYPVLFLDYLKSAIPSLRRGHIRTLASLALTAILTLLNYRGLAVAGGVAVILGVLSLLPFVVMGFISISKLRPSRWLVSDLGTVKWSLYLNSLFWNLNYFDSISTLSGEVANPEKTLPKALFYAVILVFSGYFFPLLSGTGVVPYNRDDWNDGYFSDIAKMVGGVWLRVWIQVSAAMANIGMFIAEMSSDSFQLLGMAERGMLPHFFAKRSRYGTPIIGILFSASGVIFLSWLSSEEIVAAENFLYCFGMILEFIAFITLRVKYPAASRPYKIPVGTIGSVLICTPPTILICVVLSLSSLKIALISVVIVMIGLIMQPCLKYVERKGWIKFSRKLKTKGKSFSTDGSVSTEKYVGQMESFFEKKLNAIAYARRDLDKEEAEMRAAMAEGEKKKEKKEESASEKKEKYVTKDRPSKRMKMVVFSEKKGKKAAAIKSESSEEDSEELEQETKKVEDDESDDESTKRSEKKGKKATKIKSESSEEDSEELEQEIKKVEDDESTKSSEKKGKKTAEIKSESNEEDSEELEQEMKKVEDDESDDESTKSD